MFGSIPKTLWSSATPADEQNRILLATRSLVIDFDDRSLMIDAGCGDKWSPKLRSIYGMDEAPYRPVPGVTDLVLTHLHFDHAGGISRLEDGLVANYPRARHWVGRANLENARSPNLRERASYLAENIDVLGDLDVELLESKDAILPELTVHQSDGHTVGLLWLTLTVEGTTIAYPADLIPTSAHLPVAYVMGYDMCAEKQMEEKAAFLEHAVAGSWIVVFEHDPVIEAGILGFDERGRPYIETPLQLS